MCSAPNVYMFVYILIGTHMVPLRVNVYLDGRIHSTDCDITSYLLLSDSLPLLFSHFTTHIVR